MFSDEATVSQFYTFNHFVGGPPKQRFNQKYVIGTVKRPLTIMIWGAISCYGRGGLWLMPHNTTINANTCLSIL